MSLPIWSLMIHGFILNHPGYSLIQDFFFSFLISLFLYFGISFHYFLSFLLFPFFSLVICLSKTSKQGEIVLEMLSNCTNILQLLETKTQLANNLELKHIFTFKFKYFLRNNLVFKLLWHWAKSETLLKHYTCSLKKVSLKNVSCIMWWQPAIVLHCFLFSRLNCLIF